MLGMPDWCQSLLFWLNLMWTRRSWDRTYVDNAPTHRNRRQPSHLFTLWSHWLWQQTQLTAAVAAAEVDGIAGLADKTSWKDHSKERVAKWQQATKRQRNKSMRRQSRDHCCKITTKAHDFVCKGRENKEDVREETFLTCFSLSTEKSCPFLVEIG